MGVPLPPELTRERLQPTDAEPERGSETEPELRRFQVVTTEHVEGIYVVAATSAEDARARFEARPRSEGEQISYGAFEIEVRSVKELEG